MQTEAIEDLRETLAQYERTLITPENTARIKDAVTAWAHRWIVPEVPPVHVCATYRSLYVGAYWMGVAEGLLCGLCPKCEEARSMVDSAP